MPTKVSRMPGGWASPRFPPWWSIDATWSAASPTCPAPSRASTPTGARSHEPPAGIPTLARHRRLVAAERGHVDVRPGHRHHRLVRSEEHTSELQSLMRISYAVFCLKKKNNNNYI